MKIANKIPVWIRYALISNLICWTCFIAFTFIAIFFMGAKNSPDLSEIFLTLIDIRKLLVASAVLSGFFLFFIPGVNVGLILVIALLFVSGLLALWGTQTSQNSDRYLIVLSNLIFTLPVTLLLFVAFMVVFIGVQFLYGLIGKI